MKPSFFYRAQARVSRDFISSAIPEDGNVRDTDNVDSDEEGNEWYRVWCPQGQASDTDSHSDGFNDMSDFEDEHVSSDGFSQCILDYVWMPSTCMLIDYFHSWRLNIDSFSQHIKVKLP